LGYHQIKKETGISLLQWFYRNPSPDMRGKLQAIEIYYAVDRDSLWFHSAAHGWDTGGNIDR
jgi:hypothetical protein